MFFSLQAIISTEVNIDILIDKYSKSLMRLCYLYLKDYQLAEEAVQDTLYKAYKKYSSFRGESSEKTWITKIAINICKDYMRKASYKEIIDSSKVTSIYNLEDEAASIYNNEDSIDLLNAVYSLPIKYREVMLLYYYEELSVSEISSSLKEKPNTISVRLKRAKELMKDILKEE